MSTTDTATATSRHLPPVKVWVRRMQAQRKNVTYALEIVQEYLNEQNSNSAVWTAGLDFGQPSDDSSKLIMEAMRICGHSQQPELAMKLYNKYPCHQNNNTLTMLISVFGSCRQASQAMELLLQQQEIQGGLSVACYNAAIAACGKSKDWRGAVSVYRILCNREGRSGNDRQIFPPKPTTLTLNALLTVLANCRQGSEALRTVQGSAVMLDRLSFQYLISALVRSNQLTDASTVLQHMVEKPGGSTDDISGSQKSSNRALGNWFYQQSVADGTIRPTAAMWDIVIAGYSRTSDWKNVARLEALRGTARAERPQTHLGNSDYDEECIQSSRERYEFQPWEGLTKVGQGKEAYWEVATLKDWDVNKHQSNSTKSGTGASLIVAVQPKRNPAKNGIKLLFFEEQSRQHPCDITEERLSQERTKLGFLLMRNAYADKSSTLMGMFLDSEERGRGIAKVCIATWLWICRRANITPRTGIINKPLLALLLQDRFAMTPTEKLGVPVELAPDPQHSPHGVLVYAPKRKSLTGVLSIRDCRQQHLRLTSIPPKPRGRVVKLQTSFEVSRNENDTKSVDDCIQDVLPAHCISCTLTPDQLQSVYLGR